LNAWVQKMSLVQINWAVSAVSFVLSLLILWFIVKRLNRAGLGRYKWILFSFLLAYAGFETGHLILQEGLVFQNAFFWFWGLLSIVSLLLLGWEVNERAKHRRQ
jgi:hypothetical protein